MTADIVVMLATVDSMATGLGAVGGAAREYPPSVTGVSWARQEFIEGLICATNDLPTVSRETGELCSIGAKATVVTERIPVHVPRATML